MLTVHQGDCESGEGPGIPPGQGIGGQSDGRMGGQTKDARTGSDMVSGKQSGQKRVIYGKQRHAGIGRCGHGAHAALPGSIPGPAIKGGAG